MRTFIFYITILGLLWLYQFFSFMGITIPFDPFLPVLLGFYFWKIKPGYYWFGVFLTALFLDVFSSVVPGPTVFSYFLALFCFLQFYRKLALRGFLPAFLSLIVVVILGEGARLLLFPALFEVPLPEGYWLVILKYVFGTLIWGIFCWSFCQVSFVKNVFELSTHSKS
ncbi:hypothetical protein Thein_1326 [Thermodesulfatator indicus DSM 15286]|uniref:Rod shape-determining protein MreD n=1 Tax=Thermodesulfatator indicus (strain DSM 15286 / JCM 11887 / CIR29812) TaxID=667014 RepID=F8A960_THEID|nr:hypothetical protein [Thermodesulfatator indicus]AEH45193.1 hypothetical protein Thein_1326 [Thermodesulfatator indicus DSM 15286]